MSESTHAASEHDIVGTLREAEGTLEESRGRQKALGAFYTAPSLAQAMTDWAIRESSDRVLDPSYGGCAFFAAGLRRFQALGAQNPVHNLYGVDVDSEAVRHLVAIPGAMERTNQFWTADFLSLSVEAFGVQFDAIVGNPPYVRHHNLTRDQVERARTALKGGDYALPGTAGYWAYFVLHACEFLKDGGRLAMVLPGALLNAQYAETIRHMLARRFQHTRILMAKTRLFADAEEAAVVVLADGFCRSDVNGECKLAVVDCRADLERACLEPPPTLVRVDLRAKDRAWRRALMPKRCSEVLADGQQRREVRQLGVIARIHIGVVTGANNFFVLRPQEARLRGIGPSCLRPILTSSKELPGLSVDEGHLQRSRALGSGWELMALSASCRAQAVMEYVEGDEGTVAKRAWKCRDRDPWYVLKDTAHPDAFLTYVNARAPRIVLNRSEATCTNAVHRVWWRDNMKLWQRQAVALSSLTSLAGLSSELFGRSCGGGALKLEPREAAAVLIAMPNTRGIVVGAFGRAATAIRQKRWTEAREIADEAILVQGIGMAPDDVTSLRGGQDLLYEIRGGVA